MPGRSKFCALVWLCASWVSACASAGGLEEPAETVNAERLVLQTEPVLLAPGIERYVCQDFANPFGRDIAIVESASELTPGIHHFLAFALSAAQNHAVTLTDDPLQECPSAGLEFHDFIHAAAVRQVVTVYPEGVGRLLPAARGLRLNAHLVNVTDAPIEASVRLSLKYVDASRVSRHAAGLFLNNINVSVPPGRSTQTASYTLPYDIELIRVSGHMHGRGVYFSAEAGDGLPLFETNQWAEPETKSFAPALMLQRGTQITWSCTYLNETGKTIPFGQSATEGEMCVLPGTFIGGDGNSLNNFDRLL